MTVPVPPSGLNICEVGEIENVQLLGAASWLTVKV